MDTVIVLARSRSYPGTWVMTGRLDTRLDTPPLQPVNLSRRAIPMNETTNILPFR